MMSKNKPRHNPDKRQNRMGDLAVNGDDVMRTMGIKEGKDVGRWLKEILNRVIDGRLKNDRDELIYWMTGITDGWIEF